MSSPSLPPRGIFVPTHIIFNSQLPAATLITWIQLRALAWRGWVTPPLTLPKLASLIGIHPARLRRHLNQLKDISSLSWRLAGNEMLIISFPQDELGQPENIAAAPGLHDFSVQGTKGRESPPPASYFPRQILGYLSYEDDQDECDVSDDPEKQYPGQEQGEKASLNYHDCIFSQPAK